MHYTKTNQFTNLISQHIYIWTYTTSNKCTSKSYITNCILTPKPYIYIWIYTYIWLIFMVNVDKYTSPPGCYGWDIPKKPPHRKSRRRISPNFTFDASSGFLSGWYLEGSPGSDPGTRIQETRKRRVSKTSCGCWTKNRGKHPQNGWWKSWKTLSKMDDLGEKNPLFSETSMWFSVEFWQQIIGSRHGWFISCMK